MNKVFWDRGGLGGLLIWGGDNTWCKDSRPYSELRKPAVQYETRMWRARVHFALRVSVSVPASILYHTISYYSKSYYIISLSVGRGAAGMDIQWQRLLCWYRLSRKRSLIPGEGAEVRRGLFDWLLKHDTWHWPGEQTLETKSWHSQLENCPPTYDPNRVWRVRTNVLQVYRRRRDTHALGHASVYMSLFMCVSLSLSLSLSISLSLYIYVYIYIYTYTYIHTVIYANTYM